MSSLTPLQRLLLQLRIHSYRRGPMLAAELGKRVEVQTGRQDLERLDNPLGKDYDVWEVPYLPVDPHHLGRSYEAVIRVNSQSGKGGVAYIMKFEHGLDLPRRLQIEFSSVIQRLTEASGTEITADQIWSAFERTYLTTDNPVALIGHPVITTASDTGDASIEANVKLSNGQRWLKGQGNGPIAAFVDALRGAGIAVEITDVRLPGVHAPGEGARR